MLEIIELIQGWISGAELRFMLANMGEKMSYEEVG